MSADLGRASQTALWSLERLFGLDREANCPFGRAVENLKDETSQQAPILALGPRASCQLNPAVAGLAFGTNDTAFFHLLILD